MKVRPAPSSRGKALAILGRLPAKSAYRMGSETGARRRWPVLFSSALVGAFVFALYLVTLAPGVLYYARPTLMDAAMLQVHATTLGITHPTGYPTWVMATHLFTACQ